MNKKTILCLLAIILFLILTSCYRNNDKTDKTDKTDLAEEIEDEIKNKIYNIDSNSDISSYVEDTTLKEIEISDNEKEEITEKCFVAAELYRDIYEMYKRESGSTTNNEVIHNIVDRLGENGYTVTSNSHDYNMQNIDELVKVLNFAKNNETCHFLKIKKWICITLCVYCHYQIKTENTVVNILNR